MPGVNINGTTLDYSERGTGDPVVLVHGSASDYRTWQLQHETFAGRFRTIVYSRRHHWPNAGIPEDADYVMDEHVDDLKALLLSLEAAPAHLVGHSYGAFLCLLLAVREPAMVRSLVLAEPPVLPLFVSNPPTPAQLLGLLFSRPRTAAAIMAFGARGIAPATRAARQGELERASRIFGTAVLGQDFYRRLSDARLQQIHANSFRAELLGSGFSPITADQVRGVRAPALLIVAQHSPALFHRLTDRLCELLPHSERIEIDGASHLMHEDNPTAYNSAVQSYLNKA